MKELDTNNSKKLIIGISILFCTVILIIGGTFAFFAQSDNKDIGNVLTTNIEGTLLFDDNNNYMFGNFIPVEENDVLDFASKTDKCKYQDDMYACNLYEFTITNDSNVSQELIFTLDVKENGFSNLYYNLIEGSINNISTSNLYTQSKVHIDGTGEKEILNGIVLGPKLSKTYTIIYYVKNLSNVEQTSMDANKKFRANVRVDSITTGMYADSKKYSKECWVTEQIKDTESEYYGTYILREFRGIDNNGSLETNENYGSIDQDCTGFVEVDSEGFYYIEVPSKLDNEIISTIGNSLFMVYDLGNDSFNNYNKIKYINIHEGIKVIEDGCFDSGCEEENTPFFYVGFDFENEELAGVDIKLPSTLTKIGDFAFYAAGIKNITLPNYLKYIGHESFKITGLESSFDNPLIIPASVTTIGREAFYDDVGLTHIKYMGNREAFDKLGNDWYEEGVYARPLEEYGND